MRDAFPVLAWLGTVPKVGGTPVALFYFPLMGIILCQHMRYGDSGGNPPNHDAVPFKNICLEVRCCVTHTHTGEVARKFAPRVGRA